MAEAPLYNHQDIARYLQHQMSRQEMHAFEKALMDDPFLADALEGFSAADPALTQAHMAGIEQGLANRREKTKIVALLPKKTPWRKVAAVIIVIAAGGAFSYSLFRDKKDTIIVAQKMTSDSIRGTARQQAQAGTAPAEQSRAAPDQQESKSLPVSPGEGSLASSSKKQARSAPASGSYKMEDTVSLALSGRMAGIAISDSAAPAPVSRNEMAKASPMKESAVAVLNEFTGKVTDTSGEPIQFASITENKTRAATSTDANGNFILRAPDTVISITVNSAGFSGGTATIKSREKSNKITLEKGSQSLAEVVTVGYGSTKKKSIAGADSSGAAEPVGGWKNFRQYLNRQIDSLHTAASKDQYMSDDVVLEFSIDKQGNPANIQVPEQASQAVANKAVEILSNGPKWKNKKSDKKVKVVIPFRSGK